MLTTDANTKELFKDVSSLIESIDLMLVETILNKVGSTNAMRVVLAKKGAEISTEDLEKAYVVGMTVVIAERDDLLLSARKNV